VQPPSEFSLLTTHLAWTFTVWRETTG